MTSRIEIRIDDARVLAAFERAREAMTAHVGGALEKAAGEIASLAKINASKSDVTQVNSKSIDVSPITRLAWMVRAGTNYAAFVEYGTGPAAGRASYVPNRDRLLEYLELHPRYRGAWAKAGSKKRMAQEHLLRYRAIQWQKYIKQHGTKAQPFMAPAAEAKRDRCTELVRAAVNRGLLEVFGGHA